MLRRAIGGGDAKEVERLKAENAELKKKLAEITQAVAMLAKGVE